MYEEAAKQCLHEMDTRTAERMLRESERAFREALRQEMLQQQVSQDTHP